MSVHEILLATDFSDLADAAARVAHRYAERFGARVHLFHALGAGEHDVTRLLAQSREALGGIPVVTASTTGDPATEIVQYAARHGVDLIVLGTHGRTGVSRALLGSVAERVIRTAPCPVLAVPRPREVEAVIPAIGAPTEVLSRCLVCAEPSRDLICAACRAKIRGEALEHKRREERAGRP